MDIIKRKSVIFRQEEIDTIFDLTEKYKHVVFNKTTDSKTNREKNNIWKQIEKEFNDKSLGVAYRSAAQLKNKFINLRRFGKPEWNTTLKKINSRDEPSPSDWSDSNDLKLDPEFLQKNFESIYVMANDLDETNSTDISPNRVDSEYSGRENTSPLRVCKRLKISETLGPMRHNTPDDTVTTVQEPSQENNLHLGEDRVQDLHEILLERERVKLEIERMKLHREQEATEREKIIYDIQMEKEIYSRDKEKFLMDKARMELQSMSHPNKIEIQ